MKKFIIAIMVIIGMVAAFTAIKSGIKETYTTETYSMNMRFENPQTGEIKWIDLSKD